jgi:hypothetical protein
MAENVTVRPEDVLPVHSRISWGAIFAGAMVALALYFVLALLGAAIGLSVSGRVRAENIGSGAAWWAIGGMLLSLFVGGYVTSQCTVGETKGETVMYGIILWGVVFGMLLWLAVTGVSSGFQTLMGVAHIGTAATQGATASDWEAAAQRAGVSKETIEEWKRKVANTPDAARRTTEDPQTQQAVSEATTRVAWWALLGTVLSMVTSVLGAYVGAGPTFRLMRIRGPHTRVGYREPASRP